MLKGLKLLVLIVLLSYGITSYSEDKDPFKGVEKILIIGNSLSSHHVKPSIGWNNKWGMAASAKDKDYVHVLIKELDRLYPKNKHTFEIIRLKNEAKMTGVDHLLKKKADLIIIQHGENFRGKATDEELRKPYEEVIKSLKKHVTPNVICVGSWSLNPAAAKKRSDMMQQAAENQNVPYVNITQLGYKVNSAWADKTFAKASNGVKWHPSDKGMRLIAEKILSLSPKFKEEQVKKKQETEKNVSE